METAVALHAKGLPIPVEVKGEGLGRHPKSVESAVYFVVAEAVTNSVKHGDPSRIEITLSDADGLLRVDIDDNGAGFDPHQTGDGVGLINIRDRIEALGGDVHLTSTVGAGTRVSVRVPILEGGGVPHFT